MDMKRTCVFLPGFALLRPNSPIIRHTPNEVGKHRFKLIHVGVYDIFDLILTSPYTILISEPKIRFTYSQIRG